MMLLELLIVAFLLSLIVAYGMYDVISVIGIVCMAMFAIEAGGGYKIDDKGMVDEEEEIMRAAGPYVNNHRCLAGGFNAHKCRKCNEPTANACLVCIRCTAPSGCSCTHARTHTQ